MILTPYTSARQARGMTRRSLFALFAGGAAAIAALAVAKTATESGVVSGNHFRRIGYLCAERVTSWYNPALNCFYIEDSRGVVRITLLAIVDAMPHKTYLDVYDEQARLQLGVEPATRRWSLDRAGTVRFRARLA